MVLSRTTAKKVPRWEGGGSNSIDKESALVLSYKRKYVVASANQTRVRDIAIRLGQYLLDPEEGAEAECRKRCEAMAEMNPVLFPLLFRDAVQEEEEKENERKKMEEEKKEKEEVLRLEKKLGKICKLRR
jgi:hypothetical protein